MEGQSLQVESGPQKPALEPQPSSNSSSSSPQSQYSSASSLSEASLPKFEKSLDLSSPSQGNSNELSPLPSTDDIPPLPYQSASLKAKPPSHNDIPTSVPVSDVPQASVPSNETSHTRRHRPWLAWEAYQVIFGLIGLVCTVIGLGFYAVRSYRMAVWTTHNDEIQACASLSQSPNATVTPRCRELIANGTAEPPYGKREQRLYAPAVAASRLIRRADLALRYTTGSKVPGTPLMTQNGDGGNNGLFLVLLASVMCIYTVTALIALQATYFHQRAESYTRFYENFLASAGRFIRGLWRRQAPTEGPFQSQARSEVRIQRQYHEGPRTDTGKGVVIRHKPEDQHHLGQLRQRFQKSKDAQHDVGGEHSAAWPTTNSSSATLTWQGSSTPSNVSLHDRSKDEKYENLIELKTPGNNKAFFDPTTGEYVHLNPWKSTHSGDEDSGEDDPLKVKAQDKGSLKRALTQMGTGMGTFGAGKSVDDKLTDVLQKEEEKKGESEHSIIHVPQNVGDSLAGEVTREE